MSSTLADRVIAFNDDLTFDEMLPPNFRVLNPFVENAETMEVMAKFYQKFYADQKERKFIIGINPSRHGAGVTGVPFTDTKRLESVCGIEMKSAHTHEISSVFVYDVIEAFGGPKSFYQEFYINSPFPLAIIHNQKADRWINANYYDDKNLFQCVRKFMIEALKIQFSFGLKNNKVYVLGKKNAKFIQQLNDEAQLFNEMVVLEHPRYIQQYKSKEKQYYIDKYLLALQADAI